MKLTKPQAAVLREIADGYDPYDLRAIADEEWRPVPSFGDYIVSNLGRIRHRRVNSPILKGSFDKDGYRRVCLNGCTLRVHVIVCEAFHGMRPEGMHAAHLDGDNQNNRATNLAWVTPRENSYHKKIQGRPNGSRQTKLSADVIAAIKASPLSSRKAAKAFGLSQSFIVQIRNGKRLASLSAASIDHWCLALTGFSLFETIVCMGAAAFMGVAIAVQL